MAVRIVRRRGKRRLIIDIGWRKPDGTWGRYRRDAQVQSVAAANAELRRRLAALALTGSPELVDAVDRPTEQTSSAESPRTGTGPKFSVVAESYLEDYAPSALKPSTAFNYAKVIRALLIPEIGEQPVDTIDATTVRAIDRKLWARGAKPATRRNAQAVLRSIVCRYAVEVGHLALKPAMPPMPKVGATVIGAMSRREVLLLLFASKSAEALAFRLAAYAGLRAGEVRGLRWRDVNLDTGHISIRQAVCRGQEAPPKSGHQRRIPLVPDLADELRKVGPGRRDAFVSLSERGKPWTEHGLLNAFRRACKRAGLVGWSFHSLRHYFVTALFRAGVGAPTVRELAGHLHLSTTQRYAHTTEEELEEAIRKLL